MPHFIQVRRSLLRSLSTAVTSTIYDGFVATRGYYPSQVTAWTHANARSGHYARSAITQLKILCPNYWGPGELSPGASLSVTASVEYPAGVFTQILFGGSTSGTAADGGSVTSDYVTVSIPVGELFWIRVFLQCSVGIIESQTPQRSSHYDNDFMGDRFENSASDHTMSGEILFAGEQVSYVPWVIAPISIPSILIIGDSIVTGVTDIPDITGGGSVGMVERTIGPKFGYCNIGLNAEAASDFVANHSRRLTDALPYCSHAIVGYGTNDLFNGDSAATIEGNLATIYGYLTGKTVFQMPIVPRTTGAWTLTDRSDQTVAASESRRLPLNTDIRAAAAPAGGIFDTAAVVENTGKWIATKTDDGIHPNYSGYADIKNSGAIDTSRIGIPTTIPSESGSGWGDHGTHVSISTDRRTNDTVTQDGTNTQCVVRGTQGRSSGLLQFEVWVGGRFNGSLPGFIIGLIDGTTANGSGLDEFLGNVDNGFGVQFADGAGGPTYAFGNSGTIFGHVNVGSNIVPYAGDVARLAVDFTNGFAYVGKNAAWLNSGVPTSGATGTGHIASWTPGLTLYPAMSLNREVVFHRLKTNGGFQYPLEAGFSVWG